MRRFSTYTEVRGGCTNIERTRSFSHENNAVRFIRPILNVGPVPKSLPGYGVDLSKQPSQPVESGEL